MLMKMPLHGERHWCCNREAATAGGLAETEDSKPSGSLN